ncbi:MAG: hypothetical protein IJD28_05345 [Deferribacterales bacterium]|nr:hypothetical protein [Deferribacterales bacterium]
MDGATGVAGFRVTMINIIKNSAVIMAFAFAVGAWGCGKGGQMQKVEYVPVYKYVKIPVACQIPFPKRPEYTGDVVKDNVNILIYAESLESALKECSKTP